VTPQEAAVRTGELLGVPAGIEHGEAVVDVAGEDWVAAATAVRDDPALRLVLFDLLTGVDEDDALEVVLRLWSPAGRHALRLRTRCPRARPVVPSVSGVFAGAAWHERATAEMFGVVFEGHPSPAPLLLPDGFAGHPLRKDFVLASRVVREWPGAVDPAAGPPRRRGPTAPGVPEGWERE